MKGYLVDMLLCKSFNIIIIIYYYYHYYYLLLLLLYYNVYCANSLFG